MKKYKYKISVIVPIYNVEQYLEECLDSVINQSIGFDKNVQLILVNDESPDKSEEICLKYAKKYPDNIIYIKQKNSGVSAARNNGLKYAEGEYINFLDSDDKWDLKALETGCDYLKIHQEVDLVCFRIKFFEAKIGYHALDYKYNAGCDVVDIHKNPSFILLHSTCCIFRHDAIKNKKFDSRLKICEDTKFLYNIILEKEKYGIISHINYNYRKRANETSAIQSSKGKEFWYTDTIEYAHKYLVDLSKEKYNGKVIKYVQYFIMYELQWRLMAGIKVNLTAEQRQQYLCNLKYLLTMIDDDVIIAQKNINFNYKLYAFLLKYGKKLYSMISIKDDNVYIDDILIDTLDRLVNNIELFELSKKDELLIVGNVNYITNVDLYYKYNGKLKKLKVFEKKYEANKLDNAMKRLAYKEYVNLKESGDLEFYIEINNKMYKLTNNLIHFSRLNNLKYAYYFEQNFLFIQNNTKNKIIVQKKPNKMKVLSKEITYLLRIIVKDRKYKVALIRIFYWLSKPFMRKQIWLFCDREFMAGDSAEILFRYFNSHNKSGNNKSYFVVDKNYKDYNRMKQYGNVVSYHSLKYKLLFLHSKFLISSHADGYVNNEFGKSRRLYIDLYRFKYVYLTHGILLHDSSAWLNRINKNFALNVVTSPMEYESIIKGPYYFEPSQLIKTGMPRYDNLFNLKVEEQNKILFMPSWRSSLVSKIIPGTQRREYNPNFKESEYFKFYEKLFSDDRLLSRLREKNIKIKFCIHPSFRAQVKDFVGNDCVEFAIDVNSQYETLSSKLLVTDYSSAACDFAYLNKPVIYANFDYDHIYDVHYYNKGYFDYDKHGFGPNCMNYEQFINELIKSIDSNFVVENKYKQRMKKFFYYRDNNNSKRVYNELLKLQRRVNSNFKRK